MSKVFTDKKTKDPKDEIKKVKIPQVCEKQKKTIFRLKKKPLYKKK